MGSSNISNHPDTAEAAVQTAQLYTNLRMDSVNRRTDSNNRNISSNPSPAFSVSNVMGMGRTSSRMQPLPPEASIFWQQDRLEDSAGNFNNIARRIFTWSSFNAASRNIRNAHTVASAAAGNLFEINLLLETIRLIAEEAVET